MNETTIENQLKEIKAYFDHIVMGYLAGDILTLLNPSYELDKRECGGCAAPIAMSVLSGIEQLGFLTSQNVSPEIEKLENTELRIKEYCLDWMSKADKIYKKSTLQEIIVRFFRHGIAHQFMPIPYMAITRHPNHIHLIESYDKEGKTFYILQVSLLARHFLESLHHVEIKINNSIEKDPGFISRFCRRLNKQKDRYLDKNEDLFRKAAKNLETNFSHAEPNTTISGTNTHTVDNKTTMTV